jgi:hypothetical protein
MPLRHLSSSPSIVAELRWYSLRLQRLFIQRLLIEKYRLSGNPPLSILEKLMKISDDSDESDEESDDYDFIIVFERVPDKNSQFYIRVPPRELKWVIRRQTMSNKQKDLSN